MTTPSCLSCRYSEPFTPKRHRSERRHRCQRRGFQVDGASVPGRTITCDLFSEPDVPFAWPEVGDGDPVADRMPVELL